MQKNKGVKKLLLKLTLLVLPFAVWPLIEVFLLPMNFFTFRIWETISVNTVRLMSGPFYPNMHMKMEEEGELAPHTPYATKRLVEWRTDEYGYRNSDTEHDVLLIGDSNITGSKLSQEETLAEVLENNLGRSVYSFAPATVNRFLATDRFEQDPPELVIVSSIERRIPELPPVGDNSFGSKVRNFTGNLINSSPALTYMAVTIDRISKFGLYHYTLANIDRATGRREYISYNNEFFIEGETANRDYSEQEIKHFADVLEGYKLALAERGIKFMFLPIPNKENIYHQLLPSQKKPNFLPKLMAELDERGVAYINTQDPFDSLYQQKQVQLYPADDAHWNEVAVKVAAQLVAKHVNIALDEKGILLKNKKNFVNYKHQ